MYGILPCDSRFGRTVFKMELTHPDKVLFEDGRVTKGELAAFFEAVREPLLRFARGHVVFVKRYPEGTGGKGFFQKNLPEYAPEWMKAVDLGKWKKARYTIVEELDTILWWVNQDAIEFHLVPLRAPDFKYVRYMVFDLDPPEGMPFAEVRDFALAIRPVIESFGYATCVKPSGKRGAHIYCPLEPRWTAEEVFAAAKEVGEAILERFPGHTLDPRAERGPHSILVDILRNHPFQSAVMPWSTRAVPEATVSLPLTWESFGKMESPKEFTVRTVPSWYARHGDAWADFAEKAGPLHTSGKR